MQPSNNPNRQDQSIDKGDYLHSLEECKLLRPGQINIDRMSDLPSRTLRETPANEQSLGAQNMVRAGYISKLGSGIYNMLPLGLKVQNNIEGIIREKMLELNSQELSLPILQPSELLKRTDRWDVDVLYKIAARAGKEFNLAFTHEENCAEVLTSHINSYKDLPKSVFQIQTKFRDEARAKSGILRGKEFRMKDMYSFHENQEDLDSYFNKAHVAYMEILEELGLGDITYLTYASGGVHAKYSFEYQTLCDVGEDIIYLCEDSRVAINKELFDELGQTCPVSGSKNFTEHKATEVANIFKLGTRYTDAYDATFKTQDGSSKPIYMASYGIGTTRLMGTLAEATSDQRGLAWPTNVAPYKVQLVSIAKTETDQSAVEDVISVLERTGVETLVDDREKLGVGRKLKDAELMGMPYAILVGGRSLQNGAVEVHERRTGNSFELPLQSLGNFLLETFD